MAVGDLINIFLAIGLGIISAIIIVALIVFLFKKAFSLNSSIYVKILSFLMLTGIFILFFIAYDYIKDFKII